MDHQRFTLLLLEPNEIYFEDFYADMTATISSTQEDQIEEISGRLKVCSKSMVFEPKDTNRPLMKVSYKDIKKIEVVNFPAISGTKHLAVRCTQYIEMLERNILSSYKFRPGVMALYFNFHFVDVNDCEPRISQLQRASTLSAIEQSNMIAMIVFSRHSRVKFNPLWLNNIYERTFFDSKADEINPLVVNPGRILLTDKFIYFQPYNNINPYPVIKINLKSITSVITRRFLLRHTGLEISWQSDRKHSIYLSFRNPNERSKFFEALKEAEFDLPQIEPESMTLKWQNHLVSNYEYLLYLNSIADRTFRDLTQYPVFPWIIKDYTSNEINLEDEAIYRDLRKPIGALNPKRLAALKERCAEMDEPKFLYGSHYSTPGFVLFYLVRKHPHLMLCLQNGRFDHPDRMFNSIADTFRNCLVNMSDFKELIPEFYDEQNDGDFLINSQKINFGTRTDNTPVNHVALPPWAKSSPKNFISTLRNALESDYVSKNLNHWIDLVFGYKQRGEEAFKSDNLFFHLCYEGSIDLDSVDDFAQRHALEVQISEFGQIPKQLFTKPHVARNAKDNQSLNLPPRNSFSNTAALSNLQLKLSYIAHKETISAISIDEDVIISTGMDGILKCFKISEERQIRSISLGKLPLSACAKIKNCNVLITASWDNTISIYDCDYGKVSNVIPAHDDAVSCLHLLNESGILVSGSWDCSVKVWKRFRDVDYKLFRLSDALIAYLPLEERVLCLDCRYLQAGDIHTAIGIATGEILLWKLRFSSEGNWSNIESSNTIILANHNAEVISLAFNESGAKVVSCSETKLFITDVCTGMNLFKQNLKIKPLCLEWCGESDILLVGDVSGLLSIWDLKEGKLKCDKRVSNGPISCVKFLPEKNLMITGGRDNNDNLIKCWVAK